MPTSAFSKRDSVPGEQVVNKQKPLFKWYKNMHRGLDWTRPPPESRPSTPSHDEENLDQSLEDKIMLENDVESVQTLQFLEGWLAPRFLRRPYTYESLFHNSKRRVEAAGIQNQLMQVTGKWWAVPRDGRLELGFSPIGLRLDAESRAQTLQRLASFSLDEAARGVRTGANDFLICGLDPWNQYYLIYKCNGILGGPLRPRLGNPVWEVEWESQDSDVVVYEVLTIQS